MFIVYFKIQHIWPNILEPASGSLLLQVLDYMCKNIYRFDPELMPSHRTQYGAFSRRSGATTLSITTVCIMTLDSECTVF
jgi:hypothetical protein